MMAKRDWEHRLMVLRAWRTWCDEVNMPNFPDRDDTYRAVLDGCAITVRALCVMLEVGAQFTDLEKKHASLLAQGDRSTALRRCYNGDLKRLDALDAEERRCMLEVLFLGNRAVAHPKDGALTHKVRRTEMTSAINTLLRWLDAKRSSLPELALVGADLLQPIPAPRTPGGASV